MDLEHSFTVPVGVERAWAEFQDISSVAQCFPGATVTGVDGDSFTGSVKVKLGPIALVYNGSGTFTEKDESEHRFVVDAKGKDKRGNGTAGATVTLTMAGDDASTDVTVVTDLAITGKPAQFGRGVIKDVSDKLLGQFVACLEQRLGESGAAAGAPSESGDAATDDSAPGVEAAATAAAAPDATPPAPDVSEPTPQAGEAPTAVAPAAPGAAATPRSTSTSSSGGSGGSSSSGDALNLGRTVLPVLAKSYWKPAAAAVVVIAFIVWLVRR
jgi:carbon monoxide dehydrogenase subunit G